MRKVCLYSFWCLNSCILCSVNCNRWLEVPKMCCWRGEQTYGSFWFWASTAGVHATAIWRNGWSIQIWLLQHACSCELTVPPHCYLKFCCHLTARTGHVLCSDCSSFIKVVVGIDMLCACLLMLFFWIKYITRTLGYSVWKINLGLVLINNECVHHIENKVHLYSND